MSHTVSTKIEFRNPAALAAAVTAMGGTYLGSGTHRLFAGQETGLGFRLPRWQYPLVATDAGSLKYDDYSGAWGNTADLETLKGRYAIEAARHAATAECWMTQDQPDGSLLIYHPDGGTLTVTAAGQIEASGFTGNSCAHATEPIARALGQTTETTQKEAYNQLHQQVNQAD